MTGDIQIDPRLKIAVIPDGEIHILIRWTYEDLEMLAKAFLAAGETKSANAVGVLRMRNKDGVDHLIKTLIAARVELWGSGA